MSAEMETTDVQGKLQAIELSVQASRQWAAQAAVKVAAVGERRMDGGVSDDQGVREGMAMMQASMNVLDKSVDKALKICADLLEKNKALRAQLDLREENAALRAQLQATSQGIFASEYLLK